MKKETIIAVMLIILVTIIAGILVTEILPLWLMQCVTGIVIVWLGIDALIIGLRRVGL